MSDLLAIAQAPGTDDHADDRADERLVDEIRLRHPDRVTVLLDEGDDRPQTGDGAPEDDSPIERARRARLTKLISAIEQRTGAVVVGFVRNRDDLRGWRFDRTVGAPERNRTR